MVLYKDCSKNAPRRKMGFARGLVDLKQSLKIFLSSPIRLQL